MNLKKERTEVRDSVDTSYILERSKFVDVEDQKIFLDKKWVWVPDAKHSYLPGWIVQEKDDTLEVDCDGDIREFRTSEVMRMNPPKFDMVEDLAALSHLNEPSVLFNLTKRYKHGHIYTYSGLFLLAMNPYRDLSIYSPDYIKKYTMRKKNELDPHIFAVANEAYNSMLTSNENQSILITGESGAGKTENTKKVIEFLASVAGYKTEGISIDRKIIDSNPILEAFGNAKTVKNDNSSRFGKFIQIKFTGGNICGANIEKYLLEKSRITGQNSNERNYHIFYQLLNGADSSLRQALFLDGSIESYRFLKNGCKFIEGVDDSARFKELRECFRALDIDEETELFYYKIVAAVLHLGNLEFEIKNVENRSSNNDLVSSNSSSVSNQVDISSVYNNNVVSSNNSNYTNYSSPQVEVVNIGTVDKICRLLSISSSDFIKCLIYPEIKAGHEVVTQHRTIEQVYRIVEALAKILYDKMFDSLISNLNRCLGTTVSSAFIGVLDIAGFEIFKDNSFEQLCINYTNEKLQQYFNHHMFILEQEIYRQEAIDWDFIDFGLDLQPTIDLIESSNPIGIMAYLDEECVMPCASEKTFLEKLLRNIKSPKFKKINFKDGFHLRHYAGDVEYSVNDWIIKNKDPNSESITNLINKSEDTGVSSLSLSESTNLKKGFFRTVSQKHKDQLFSLMKTLSSTHPHFVRCIIPNLQKTGNLVENRLILEQLKCNGVLEGIRISRQGFPSRMKYSEFVERYVMLIHNGNGSLNLSSNSNNNTTHLNNNINTYNTNNLDLTKQILSVTNISPSQYRLGKTKVFFRQSVLADIEDLRDCKISLIMKEVQSIARRKMALRKFNIEELRRRSIGCLKKNSRLCVDLQNWNWWKLYLKIKPLLDVRKRDNEIKEKENLIKKYSEAVDKERSRIKDLEKKIKDLGEENEILKKNIESEKQYSYERDELMNGIRLKNKDLEEKISKINEENKNIQDFLEKTMNKLNEDNLNLKKLKEDNFNLKKDLQEMNSISIRNKELEEKVLEQENELKKSYLEFHNTESESKTQFEKFIETKEKEIENLKRKIENTTKEFEDEKSKSKDLLEEINLLKENIKNKDEKNKEIISSLNKLEDENTRKSTLISTLETQTSSLTISLKKLKEENSDLQTENEKYESENNRLLRQNEEKENKIKKILAENDFIKINNLNLLKTISSLKDRLIDFEKERENERENQLLRNSTQEGLLEKIKNLEKKNKSLIEKSKHLENLNLQLTEEKEEIHKENLNLLQSKLDDIFQRESEFNSLKNKLQIENQKLINENQRITRELYEQRIQSESSDDSNSATEKLYSLLETEKKNRRESEQKIIEKENLILVLRNENEELKDTLENLNKEKGRLEEDLIKQMSKFKDLSTLSKEVDNLLMSINGVITGINSKYFNILDNNRLRIFELNEKLNQKEEEIRDLNIRNMKNEENNSILEEKNLNLINLNKINTSKMDNLLNEYDNLKIKEISLETEMEEKNIEIEKYKEEISRLENETALIKKSYNEEINAHKEEVDAFMQSLKLEQTNLIQNLKNKENKTKAIYEEKIQNLKEIYKKKQQTLEGENENLKKLINEFEIKINQEMALNCEINKLEVSLCDKCKESSSSMGSSMGSFEGGSSMGIHKVGSLEKNPFKSPSQLIVYVTDKQKLKDLERKKLIFQKELETNREVIEQLKENLHKFEKENGLLKNERLNLKSQVFELRKNSNTLSVKLEQIERELKDEKELVGFLKGFSLSRKSKK